MSVLVWFQSGIPQGFVLGPFLLYLFTFPLFHIYIFFYEDDSQIYIHSDDNVAVAFLSQCISFSKWSLS